MYSRLLVPLDGSHLAESVLPVVERLAVCAGATIVLLHVVERGAPSAVHGERHLTSVDDATPYLEELAAGLRERTHIAVEAHAHPAPEGDVAGSIVNHSGELHTDLIVLCTHGKGRMRDLLFGRIAQQVLRRGTAPVLLIRPRDDGIVEPFDPRMVLVPLDVASHSKAALDPALEIAGRCGTGLRLVTVVPTQETLRGDRQAVGTLLPAATRAALDLEEEDAQSHLAHLAADLSARSSKLPISAEVLRGDVAGILTEQTGAPDVGLIVMVTHGHAGLQAIWGGSVAAHLLARIRVPILLIRTPD